MRPKTSLQVLREAKLRAFLISNLTNIRYITGISSGLLLATPKRFFLFVDSRYMETAEKFATRTLSIRSIEELDKELKSYRTCGYESDDITIQRFALWKKKFKRTKFVPKAGVVEAFRRQKEDNELRSIRLAEKITRELLRRVPGALRAGLTEEKLARQLQIWALELGAEGLAFDPIVAFGTHTSRPHHRPTNRKLIRGHLVQIDVGAKVNGYCSDASEVFFTAKATPLQKRIYAALREAQDASRKMLKNGVSNRDLDAAARAVLAEEGLDEYFTHALGHGVGLDVHEGVTLSGLAPVKILLSRVVVRLEP